MDVNKSILVGRIGKEPDLRYTPSGVAVVTFSLATSKKIKPKNGDPFEKTQWHNIVVWRQQAEFCGKYLKKGDTVYLEGEITYREYEHPRGSGNKRYITEIEASLIGPVGARPSAPGNTNESGGPAYEDEYPPLPEGEIPF